MGEPMSGQRVVVFLSIVAGLIGVLLCWSQAEAKSSSSATNVKAAACDYHSRPTITMVTPDRARPGQRITISGKNFGSKNCFHSVSFGPKSTGAFTYVNATTVEATVPNLLPGSIPVMVSTEGGNSQYNFEVQAK